MMLRLFFLAFAVLGTLSAQTPPTEVVMSASSGTKLAIALPIPETKGLDVALVSREFHSVLQKDLEDAGPFAVIKGNLPVTSDSSFKPWVDAGIEWLAQSRATATGSDVEVLFQVTDTRNGKSVFTKKYAGAVLALRRMAHKASDDLVEMLTGERGIASTRIVFVRSMGNGIKELWQMDRDGASLAQITHYKSLTMSPALSKDGRLAYVTYKGGSPEIWGQKKTGASHVRLSPAPSADASGHCFAPAWSPDGKKLAFVQGDRRGNSDIMTIDIETGRVRRLTDGHCINTSPCWNPAGTQIAFTSDRSGSPQIYLMEDDGSNVRRLTTEGSYNESAAWSPFGGMIAYVSRFEGKFDLFVYKLGEGKAYQVTTGIASSENPAWSPDERHLVFSSGSRGGLQLYTTDLSGNRLGRLTDLVGLQSPKWTRSR